MVVAVLWAALPAVLPAAHGGDSALVSFEKITVPPVGRAESNELIEAGTLDVEGYKEVVLSIGGELKKASARGGTIGAILIPDRASFEFVRRNERLYPFPMEVVVGIEANALPVFLGKQVVARIAFPRYRVLLYNSTDRTATVSLFAYRSH
jgi:hypothetical protein